MPQKTPTYDFGEYPLHVVLSEDKASYELDPEETRLGEPAGIPELFPVECFPFMHARAYAHGYALQVEEVPATVLVPVVGK